MSIEKQLIPCSEMSVPAHLPGWVCAQLRSLHQIQTYRLMVTTDRSLGVYTEPGCTLELHIGLTMFKSDSTVELTKTIQEDFPGVSSQKPTYTSSWGQDPENELSSAVGKTEA